jgi:hypothetical protein
MKWVDYGQIFNTDKHGLDYAKSPQAIVLDDFIRIYFTACKPDNGKLISYVCFVDFDKQFKNILRISKDVLSGGDLGCFDEHGIFPFSPVKAGGAIYGYTGGISRRVSVSVDSGIGLTISHDNGETFERFGNGPVVTSSLHEPFLVIDGFVREYKGSFHMWYIFGTDWIKFNENIPPDRIYKITHAVSNDGIKWEKDNVQIITDVIEHEAQALPTVIKWQNKYHMMFCYRHAYDFRTNFQRSYRLGYAVSDDLFQWQRNDSVAFICEQSWAREMICYPNLFECDNKLYLLYNGNEFGKHGFGLAKLAEQEN